MDGQIADFAYLSSKQKIQDIFYNILSNALKYSPLGSVVLVSIVSDSQHDSVQIRDQGPGFSKEDFEKIFQPGAKLSALPSGGESSNGIGLYSVKNTVDSLQAEVDIRNNKDRGACVTIKFPRKSQAAAQGAESDNAHFQPEILIN